MVKRNDLRHLPSIRYRCDAQPKFLQESCGADYVTYCNDYDCRDRSRAGLMKHEHILEPSRAQNFAFGLFLTSKTVSDEAIKIFFGQTHFIFESRFDLCRFLSAVGEQAKHVKSVTFNWRKSRGHHSNEVEASHTTWKLQSADCRGPTELTSLQELAEHCPHLEYVEIVGDLGIRPKIALQSGSHLDCPYVQILCSMRLQGFSYLFPSTTRRGAISASMAAAQGLPYISPFDYPDSERTLNQRKKLWEAVEAGVRKKIKEQSSGEENDTIPRLRTLRSSKRAASGFRNTGLT
jgi:hypothetical protein